MSEVNASSRVQVYLLDGTYELFRMFYGAPSAKVDGVEVAATRAWLRNLHTLISKPSVTHVAVAYDYVIESFRNELFDGYKTGAGIDPDLYGQFRLIEEASEALGVTTWRMKEFEADDGIASAAAHLREDPNVEKIFLASPDKDLAQCVRGDRVVMLDRRKNAVLNEGAVVEKFGVAPASIPDYLGLVGDAADGIPGIARWGAKGTAQVLQRYGHIASIPANHDDWDIKVRGGKTLAKNLENERENAELYRRLAVLREDAFDSLDLADVALQAPDRARLEALAERLGDRRILERVFPR